MIFIYNFSRSKFCSALIGTLLIFAGVSQIEVHAQATDDADEISVERDVRPGFFSNMNLDIAGGFGNYSGNFNPQGLSFLPPRGALYNINLAKPVYTIEDYDITFMGRLGLDYIHYNSGGISVSQASRFAENNSGGVMFTNVINNAFGLKLGFAVNIPAFLNLYVEPTFDMALYGHVPRTDGFVDEDGNTVLPSRESGFTNPYDNFVINDTPDALLEGESIPTFIPAANFGMKFGTGAFGADVYLKYDYHQFLNPYFDATDEAVTGRSASNAMSTLSLGVSVPLGERSIVNTRVRGAPGSMSREEQVRELAFSIESREDAEVIMNASGGRLLAADAPGVRVNPLAGQTIETTMYLDVDSLIAVDMVELPGSNYIIGLTDVDELSIQVAGNKRVSISPFQMDKHEVTLLQYRAFLISMGVDLAAEETITVERDILADEYNIEQRLSWEELLQEADLANFPEDYNNPPELNNVNYLIPDKQSWIQNGMDDIIPFERYFFGEEYLDYPVVGVNWYQAKLFAAWAGKRLPTETEWEYAAKSGVSGRVYPWDGHQLQREDGTYRANYRQARGVFDLDGYVLMAPVNAFEPNDFGLYNMAGNVSEWVLDSYNPSYNVLDSFASLSFVSPFYVNTREPRKVHRGGSWNSSAFFLGSGVRNFRDKNSPSPTVGFRLARSVEQTIR